METQFHEGSKQEIVSYRIGLPCSLMDTKKYESLFFFFASRSSTLALLGRYISGLAARASRRQGKAVVWRA